MKIFRNNTELMKGIQNLNCKIGFVPTMGALHLGHLSLFKRALLETDKTIGSIFVNPKQFSPSEDLNQYPKNMTSDINQLKDLGVDYLFIPHFDDIYPYDFKEIDYISDLHNILEGSFRPSHFNGVVQVVYRLLNLVRPDYLFLGKKDAQQLKIIAEMIDNLNMPVIVKACEIIREQSGLALSSRNVYLSTQEKLQAATIYKSLRYARSNFDSGNRSSSEIIKTFKKYLDDQLVKNIDYVSIVDQTTFMATNGNIENNALLLVAIKVGTTRLIDNIELLI
jgi:pantoate--beta-alanine ligase